MRARKTIATFHAYAFSGGMIVMSGILLVLLACEYGLMIGASFAGESLLTSLTYWTWIVTVTYPIIPYVVAVLAVSLAVPGLATFGIVLYVLALIVQCWIIFWHMLMFVDCEFDIHCADNISYIGVITGPYGGPSIRFLFLFVVLLAMAIAEIVMMGVLFYARRILIIVEYSHAMRAMERAMFSRGDLQVAERDTALILANEYGGGERAVGSPFAFDAEPTAPFSTTMTIPKKKKQKQKQKMHDNMLMLTPTTSSTINEPWSMTC